MPPQDRTGTGSSASACSTASSERRRHASASSDADADESTHLLLDHALSIDDGDGHGDDDDDGEVESGHAAPFRRSAKKRPRGPRGVGDALGSSTGSSNTTSSTNGSSIRQSLLHQELTSLTTLSLPVVLTYLLEMLPGLISVVLVGHVHHPQTAEYVDATAVSVAFVNLTALSIGIGLTTALDTMCSQAYGADESYRMGTYLQTGGMVLSILCILIGMVFYYSTDILLVLGQPVEVAELAGRAVWVCLPGVPALFLYEMVRKVLQAQNVAGPMLGVSVVANVVNGVGGYYLVYHTDWGWLGATLARTVANLSFVGLLFPYVVTSGLVSTFWTGLHLSDAWEAIPTFLSLGIPGMLQLCFEWWAFEVLSLLCGLLPDAVGSIGANAVVMNASSLVYMLYLGLSVSGNVRIGNALGGGDAERARVAAVVTIGLCVVVSLLCAAGLVSFRTVLPRVFTHDETIDVLSSKLICLAAVFQVPDAINAGIQGIFRGSGRQNLGAKLNFIAYYLLGIPLGVLLAFGYDLGVEGLWCGMTVGLSFVAVCGAAMVMKSDWAELSDDARSRVGGSKSSSDLLEAYEY